MFKPPGAALAVLFAVTAVCAWGEPPTIWLEGENLSSVPNIAPANGKPDDLGYGLNGWGRTELISGGGMLNLQIAGKDVAARLGSDGAVFG